MVSSYIRKQMAYDSFTLTTDERFLSFPPGSSFSVSVSFLHTHWIFYSLPPSAFPLLFGSLPPLPCCSIFHVSTLSVWQTQKLYFSLATRGPQIAVDSLVPFELYSSWAAGWAETDTVALRAFSCSARFFFSSHDSRLNLIPLVFCVHTCPTRWSSFWGNSIYNDSMYIWKRGQIACENWMGHKEETWWKILKISWKACK